jgi:uncharacterized lipoprotein YmbA
MNSRIALIAVLGILAALAVGCTSPPSHMYTLSRSTPNSPSSAQEPAASATGTSNLYVIVGPVSIPAMVDLPQMVIRTGPNQVSIEEFNRWAEPLQSNISRVVADELVILLATPRVGMFQQSQNADADYRVSIDVQTFESAPGDAATLSALWTVRRTKDAKTRVGRTTVREPTPNQSYQAIAAAHSRAIGQLSQDIADAIRELERAGS